MKNQKLKTGFTTGTAAAAAVKGALCLLLDGHAPESVRIPFLTEGSADIRLRSCELIEKNRAAVCTVVKDAGDDPDVTHKAIIGAKVVLFMDDKTGEVMITGGEGVGRVTKPGLEVSPGEPAINPGPRKMIRQAVEEVLSRHFKKVKVQVEIFVPDGKQISKKTMNERLGIVGGISILGTTGIVKPLSHDAYTASIEAFLSVAKAAGLNQVVLTTGRRSERFAKLYLPSLPMDAFIQMGDFFKMSLATGSRLGIPEIILAVFFAKALKMAQGVPHTHAAKSDLTLQALSGWAAEISGDKRFAEEILNANTARHAFEIILKNHPAVIASVGERMVGSARKFAGETVFIRGIIFDYDGKVIFDATAE